MIRFHCGCGGVLTAAETDAAKTLACQCGKRVKLACAENLPEGAGEGDFDAVLTLKAEPPNRPADVIVLGGCAEISIGRLPGNGIELPGKLVSRRHAKLVRVDFGPSRWTLADDGSTGGVFVNGQRIKEQELSPGDQVIIGEYKFEYDSAWAGVAAAQPLAPAAPLPLPKPLRTPLPSVRRQDVARSGNGFWTRKRIIAASVVAVIAVAAVFVVERAFNAVTGSQSRATAVLCASRLQQVGRACAQYEQQFGSYPSVLGDLAALPSISADIFLCPEDARSAAPLGIADDRGKMSQWINSNSSYIYCGTSGGILAHEKPGKHEDGAANVLRIDGGVDRLSAADLQQRLSRPPQVTARPATPKPAPPREMSLADARLGFTTTLTRKVATKDEVEQPPAGTFSVVKYKAGPGEFAAYVTPDPGDGKKHPAIVWITGGDCNTIGDVWSPAAKDNDQTAAAYRKAGIVMMFPSLRGGNGNPGFKEGLFGEVEDVLAAADDLAARPYVDPSRIYLGGHSTGGTLALLVAESSDRFRAVFCFGPASDVTNYAERVIAMPFDKSNRREVEMRRPALWLQGIRTPTFVIEGEGGNAADLAILAATRSSSSLKLFAVSDMDHFSVLAPVNTVLARKIIDDTGPMTNLTLNELDVPGLTPIRSLSTVPPPPLRSRASK